MSEAEKIYQIITGKVGLKEDAEYNKLYDPKDLWGPSLRPLAIRNFKRLVAVIYYLIAAKNIQCDLVVGAGDSGIWLAKVVEKIYLLLDLKVPTILTVPIVRFKFTYLKYKDQPLELFDNSVLVPEVKKQLKNLNELDRILFIDDEIAYGVTVREAIKVILKSVDQNKISKDLLVTIVAENQEFNPNPFLEKAKANFYYFAKRTEGMNSIIDYITPWEIEQQILTHFKKEEFGPKVIINILLDLSSKEKELMENLYIPKPIFSYTYNKRASQKVPNLSNLKKEFQAKLDLWINEAIEEFQSN